MTARQALVWLLRNAQIISWLLICLGWFLSSYLGYRFGSRKYYEERAEHLFEEVSVLIEESRHLENELHKSFSLKRPAADRCALWDRFQQLQRTFAGNRTRFQFLLNKYFGNDIAPHIDTILYNILGNTNRREESEEAECIVDDVVNYVENWSGAVLTSDVTDDEREGLKWKMMAKCGMNVKPFIAAIKKQQQKNQ